MLQYLGLSKIAGRKPRPYVRLGHFSEAVWRLLFPETDDYLAFFAIETNEGKRAAIAAALEDDVGRETCMAILGIGGVGASERIAHVGPQGRC